MTNVPTLVELCFKTIASTENFIQLNGDAIKDIPNEVLQRMLSYMVTSIQSKCLNHYVALKIRLIRQNRLVTFRFKLHGTVAETIQEIYDKVGSNSDNVRNYGLFQRSGKFHSSRWLSDNRTLSFYDLRPGDIVDFKIKKTLIKVHFWGPWTTIKTFIVDESQTVAELIQEIGHKIGIKNYDEFGIQVPKQEEDNGVVSYRWLNPNASLPEQEVDTISCTLLLRKKYFFRDFDVTEVSDNESLTRGFCQSLDAIVAGTNPCSREEAVQFAALLLQIKFGDCSPTSDESFLTDLSWDEYLPPEYVPYAPKMIKEIFAAYKRLSGMNADNSRYRYMLHARSLTTYGYTCFRVEKQLKDQTQQLLLGVSKKNILILDIETKSKISTFALRDIAQWKVLHRTISIFFVDKTEEFISSDAAVISQVLADYIYFSVSQKEQKKGKPTDFRPGSPPNGFSLRDKGLMVRKLTSMGKPPSLDEPSTPNPQVKKNPIYVDPIKLNINPLFTKKPITEPQHNPVAERNYYLRMIRNLSCLKNCLGGMTSEVEIKVKFPDKSVKIFRVDKSKAVCDIAHEIGERVGIKDPAEFSLQREEDGDRETWLNPYQTLQSQGIKEHDTLLFKKRFYYNDAFVSQSDPVYFNLLFCQAREAIVSGMYPCNLNEAVQLAATQFQINFGDHNPSIHQPGFLKQTDLKFFVPPECLEFWGVPFQKLEKLIYKEHQKLRGIKEEYAKYRYLQLCRSLRTYGTIFFQVKHQQHKGKVHPKLPSDGHLIGFSRDSIMFLTLKKKVIAEYPLSHLRKWEGDSGSFTLDFGNYEEGSFTVSTSEGEVISKYLSDYFDFVQKKFISTQTFNNKICTFPPENPESNYFLSEDSHIYCWENGKRVFTSSWVDL